MISSWVPPGTREVPAYRTILEYPLREAKGMRPALAIAACRALGGRLDEIAPTAAVLELYHNAFLVHDDVEDGSELRRGQPTLSHALGTARAVHTGDTMLALTLEPLLENMRHLDVGRALRILQLIAKVVRLTAEGQSLELEWIHQGRFDVSEAEYLEMVRLKTAWYSFAAPLLAGSVVARATPELLANMEFFALDLGVAFQIRDDVLNLEGDRQVHGKEPWGDLWEGKRTLILSHFFATASAEDVTLAKCVLGKPRHDPARGEASRLLDALLDAARTAAPQAIADPDALREALVRQWSSRAKLDDEVTALRRMLEPSLRYASSVASRFAKRARSTWKRVHPALAESVHRDFITSILDFVVTRQR